MVTIQSYAHKCTKVYYIILYYIILYYIIPYYIISYYIILAGVLGIARDDQ